MTQTVAAYDLDRATPQSSNAVASAPPPQYSDAGPRALMAQGEAFKEAAVETDRYALHLDTLQAQDALNQLRAKKGDLAYGPDGFMQVKGGAVVDKDRPGGPLLDDYKSRLQAVTDDISGKLSPRARMMFNPHASAEMTGYKTEIARHSVQQTEIWDKSVYNDATNRNLNDAVLYSGDIGQLDTLAQRQTKATTAYAVRNGLKPDALVASAVSNVYRAAIEDRIAKNDGPGALTLFNATGRNLDAKDQIEVGRSIKTVEVGQVARDYVSGLSGGSPSVPGMPSAGLVTPTTLHRAIVGQESGGRQYDSKGNVLTSIDGAQGAGQMMPETFKKYALPGEKISNREDNLAASRRAIDDYYRKYDGDAGRVAVAYFSGEGNVAPAGSPTPYRTDAKDGNGKATSSYVSDIQKRVGTQTAQADQPPGTSQGDSVPPAPAGDGTPGAPVQAPKAEGPPGFFDTRKLSIDAETQHIAATRKNQADWANNPTQMAANQHLIDMRFTGQKQQIELAKNQLADKVEDWVRTGGPGGVPATERPPPDVWNQLTFERQRKIDATLLLNAGGKDRVTDMPTFYKLSTLAGSRPLDFANVDLLPYFDKLSNKHRDELINLQRGALAADPTAGDLRTKQTIVKDAAEGVGLKWGGTRTEVEATKTNDFINWVEEAGRSWTEQNGRKPNGQEWQKITDGVTMKVPQSGMFSDSRLFEMTAADVPAPLKAAALNTFARRGAPEPSDHDLIGMHAAAKTGAVPAPYIPILGSELKKLGRAVTPQNLLGAWNLVKGSFGQDEPASSQPGDLSPAPTTAAPSAPAGPVAGNPLPQGQRLPVPGIGPRP